MGHEHPKTDSDMAHVSEGAPNMRRSVCRGVKYEAQPIKRAALLMGICRWPPSSPDCRITHSCQIQHVRFWCRSVGSASMHCETEALWRHTFSLVY